MDVPMDTKRPDRCVDAPKTPNTWGVQMPPYLYHMGKTNGCMGEHGGIQMSGGI